MAKKTTVLMAAALIVLLLGAAFLYSSLSQNMDTRLPDAQSTADQDKESTAAPDFALLDANGSSVMFSDHVGTPIVLNFWASWCGPCKNEMPAFDALASEYDGEADFMMVNLTDGSRETVESAARFIEEQGYTFPVYFDTLSEGAQAYSVRSIPATYFIGADGQVLAYSAGSLDEKTLRQGIDMILAE